MKKLIVLCLCLSLLSGCVALPALSAEEPVDQAALAATLPAVQATPRPVPGVTLPPVPFITVSAVPRATEGPAATIQPVQTYTGTYLRFDVPEDWLRIDISDGVFFYPDPRDTQHTYFFYEEVPNDLGLTETTLDLALLFSSRKAIASMVEGALAGSGMTDFSLSPMGIEKTKLNGITCYYGASNVVAEGEDYDFEGRIFLRGDTMVLLVWVGDATLYADQLLSIYDSLRAMP